MYFDEHNPPHFHAYYGEHEASIAIKTFDIISGRLPRRALGMVLEWGLQSRQELLTNWQLALEHKPLQHIPALD